MLNVGIAEFSVMTFVLLWYQNIVSDYVKQNSSI